MIKEKTITKNGNIILEVEDLTGKMTVFIKKDSKIFNIAKDIVYDEVIGITGTLGKDIIYANSIIFPDIPITHELKKHPEEIYAAFLGDMHFGSRVFLYEEFNKMISWLNGEIGTEEHKNIAKKIKYIFMIGDLVEGVGIYPGQENDLDDGYHDLKSQYDSAAELLSKISGDKKIIVCPGNHDYGRIAEPQLPLTNEYSEKLNKLKNVILVSNPGFLNFAKTKNFPGFNILMYHGYSLIYYCENVPSIRASGGQKAVDKTMKFLLQRRHLAPSHGSSLYVPDPEKDFMFIDFIPDFFVTGHIHRSNVDSYRNITMINSSCWTGKTEDQVKRGLEPQPAKLPIVNLKTRQVKIINFLKKEHDKVMVK
jgi:DNA polymerase II small subunit